MENKNLDVYYVDGFLETNDEGLNEIIRSVEEETGASIVVASPAVTFEDDDPDEKPYLLLLTLWDYNDLPNPRTWDIKIGRQHVYDYLKNLMNSEAIDPDKSFIVAGKMEGDNITFDSKPITIFRFLKVMYENKKVLDSDDLFSYSEYETEQDSLILEV